jgi:hypothetical protein
MSVISQFEYENMQRRVDAGRRVDSSPLLDGNPVERESDLHNQIIAHCRLWGWIYFHGSTAHRAMRTIGEPDFTILADGGRIFFLECKTTKGKLSPQQLAMKVWAEKLGHTIHTVRTFKEFLDQIK